MPKASPPARRARIEQRRAQILEAAASVFAHKGFERATIADIAREAGVAEGSIYNYFKNKEDLLVSLPRQMMQPNVEALKAGILRKGAHRSLPPDEALRALGRTMLGTMRQNAPLLRVLLSSLPALKPAAREKYLQTVVVYALGMVEGYLREQVAAGVLRRDLDPTMAARAFIGMFFPYLMFQDVLEIGSEAPYDPDKLVDRVVTLFLQGALAGSEPIHKKGRAQARQGTPA